jgi:hypothetical protein
MAEYNKKKSEQEIEERRAAGRTHNSPHTKIQESTEELEAISHPNEEQERCREILRSTAIRIQGEKTRSKQTARSNSQRQDNQVNKDWDCAKDNIDARETFLRTRNSTCLA